MVIQYHISNNANLVNFYFIHHTSKYSLHWTKILFTPKPTTSQTFITHFSKIHHVWTYLTLPLIRCKQPQAWTTDTNRPCVRRTHTHTQIQHGKRIFELCSRWDLVTNFKSMYQNLVQKNNFILFSIKNKIFQI